MLEITPRSTIQRYDNLGRFLEYVELSKVAKETKNDSQIIANWLNSRGFFLLKDRGWLTPHYGY